MDPSECPRFATCSAPVCPLDDDCPRTVHLPGEPVCYFLRCTGKAGADARFAADPVFQAIKQRLPLIVARFADISRRVTAAARAGYRGANLRPSAGPGPAAGGD